MKITKIRNWLKSRTQRMTAALAVSLAAVLLWSQAGAVFTGTEEAKSAEKAAPVVAWWGTLYPKFCLIDTEASSDREAKNVKIKPAFWIVEELTKLLG